MDSAFREMWKSKRNLSSSTIVDLYPDPEPDIPLPPLPTVTPSKFSTILSKFEQNRSDSSTFARFKHCIDIPEQSPRKNTNRVGVLSRKGVCVKQNFSFPEESLRIPLHFSNCPGSTGISVSADYFATGWDNGKSIALFDITTPRNPRIIEMTKSSTIWDFSFSPECPNTLVTASLEGNVQVFQIDPESVVSLADLPVSDLLHKVSMIRFHPFQKTTLMTGGQDGCIRLWDYEQNVETMSIETGCDTLFCGDWKSNLLGTTWSDRKIRIFDTRFKNSLIQEFVGHSSARPSRFVWLNGAKNQDSRMFSTLGIESNGHQQCNIWDVRCLNEPVSSTTVMKNSIHSGILEFDRVSSTLMISSKKSNVLHFFKYDASTNELIDQPPCRLEGKHLAVAVSSDRNSDQLPYIVRLMENSCQVSLLHKKTYFGTSSPKNKEISPVLNKSPISKKQVDSVSSGAKSMISSLIKYFNTDSLADEIDEEMFFLLAESLNKVIQKKGDADKLRSVKGVETIKAARNLSRQLEDANSLISILQTEINSMRSRSQQIDHHAIISSPIDNSQDNPARLPSTLQFHQLHAMVYCRMFWSDI